MNPEQKARRKESIASYAKTPAGRAQHLVKHYRVFDSERGLYTDVTWRWMVAEIISKPCIYCGSSERIGCDRVDNTKGHMMDNVVPCCAGCNSVRGNRFTHEEMLIVGVAIRDVLRLRG